MLLLRSNTVSAVSAEKVLGKNCVRLLTILRLCKLDELAHTLRYVVKLTS